MMYKVNYTYWHSSFIGGEECKEWKLYDEIPAKELQQKIEDHLAELERSYSHVSFKITRL